MDLQGAIQEAGRCLLCYDAPCNTGCGAHNDPAAFILKLRLGDIKGAVRTMRTKNILAATCAQVCPTCRLCEEGCSRSGLDEPIRISEIQAFLADYERQEGMQVLQAPASGDRKVGVIGSGPAGLSAAASLAMLGYQTVVYEKMPEPGGQLRYGIPDHRLDPELVAHEIGLVSELGVRIECGPRHLHQGRSRAPLRRRVRCGVRCPGLRPAGTLVGLGDGITSGLYSWAEFLGQSKDAGAVRGWRRRSPARTWSSSAAAPWPWTAPPPPRSSAPTVSTRSPSSPWRNCRRR